MTSITPPIFCITKNQIIQLDNSIQYAAGRLEDGYVEEEQPIFFDALGRRLNLEGEGLYRLSLPENPLIDRKALCDGIAESISECSRAYLGTDPHFLGTAKKRYDSLVGLAYVVFIGKLKNRPGPSFWNILLGRFKMDDVHPPILLITHDDKLAGIYANVADALESPEAAECETPHLKLFDCLARPVVCESNTDCHIMPPEDIESTRLLLSNAITEKIASYVSDLQKSQNLEKLVQLSKRVFQHQFDPEPKRKE